MSVNIWITGSSRGIGRAIALMAADMYIDEKIAANFVINSRHDDESLRSLELLLQKKNVGVLKLVGDISSDEDRTRMLDSIHQSIGTLDVLINNAGISMVGLLQDMTPEDINRQLAVNLTAPIILCSQVVPDLLKSRHLPRIINISSVWGNVGASCEAVYSASKGGLNSFTRALAKELAPSRIPVNAISCGLINTAMNSHLSEEDMTALFDEIPAGRAGEPHEVAQLACMLLRASDYLTGQVITLDGGWT